MDAPAIDRLEELRRNAPLTVISSRIRRARKTLGLSHDALADRLGMTRQQLIKLEKPNHRPRLETIVRIAEATGRDPEWFVDAGVDPSPFPADGRDADAA